MGVYMPKRAPPKKKPLAREGPARRSVGRGGWMGGCAHAKAVNHACYIVVLKAHPIMAKQLFPQGDRCFEVSRNN